MPSTPPVIRRTTLSALLLGLGAAFGGRPGLRAVAYPALFALLALPIPRVLLNQIMYPLQLATAKVTTNAMASGIKAPMAVHFRLLVSFHMVRIVVAQGLCSNENSINKSKRAYCRCCNV